MPTSLTDTLRLLSHEEFVSGQVLARALGCSRATVHNLLGQAIAAGVTIQAVRGRGYRLAKKTSWLDPVALAMRVAGHGLSLSFQPALDSTSSFLMQAAQKGAAHGTVALTEWQTAGRGRRGRTWLAPPGDSLCFSLLWRSQHGVAALSGLSLAVGAILIRVLRDMGLSRAAVKWPNDILVAGDKLAGVLIELTGDLQGPSAAVIGIGINVSGGERLHSTLQLPVTALEDHLGSVDRNDLFIRLAAALNEGLRQFEAQGFAAYSDAWHACHAHQDQPVRLIDGQGRTTLGVARGVDAQGALLLETAEGTRPFHSGEVSLRSDPR